VTGRRAGDQGSGHPCPRHRFHGRTGVRWIWSSTRVRDAFVRLRPNWLQPEWFVLLRRREGGLEHSRDTSAEFDAWWDRRELLNQEGRSLRRSAASCVFAASCVATQWTVARSWSPNGVSKPPTGRETRLRRSWVTLSGASS
jgi:hypothetical protein